MCVVSIVTANDLNSMAERAISPGIVPRCKPPVVKPRTRLSGSSTANARS